MEEQVENVVNTDDINIEVKLVYKSLFARIGFYLMKFLWISLGCCITYLLYRNWENNSCNIVVSAYFSILGFACFLNVGLPVDKLVKNGVSFS